MSLFDQSLINELIEKLQSGNINDALDQVLNNDLVAEISANRKQRKLVVAQIETLTSRLKQLDADYSAMMTPPSHNSHP